MDELATLSAMTNKMNMITSAALFFLAAGIFTSVTILSAYQILFAIPLFYFTSIAFREKNYHLPKSAYWLVAFTIVALISSLINFELMPKPSKNLGKLKYFLFGVGGIFVLRYWTLNASDKMKRVILNTFFVSLIVAGAYVMYRYTTDVIISGVDRRGRPLTETMRYGYGSSMILLTLLSAILHKERITNFFNHKLAIFAFVIGFLGMYLTYTRGALLGFLCGLPFVLFYYKKRLGLLVGGSAVILVGILGGIYLFGSGNYQSRFLMNKNNSSDVIRRSQWQAALIATKERPYLGWGLSNFHTQLKRIKIENDLAAKDYNDAHAHNLFLEVASGTGLIGLFFFLGWVLSWALELFFSGGLNRALIIPFGVAFVISSQFEVTFDANNACMIFFLYSLSSARFYQASLN